MARASRSRVIPVLAAAIALAASAVAAACSSKHDATAPYRPPPECDLAGQPAPGATQAYVAVRGFAFSPDTLRVAPGTTVTWVNCEQPSIDAHTATATGAEWDSGYLQPGQKFARTFALAGRFSYACVPHPFMRGAVVVQ